MYNILIFNGSTLQNLFLFMLTFITINDLFFAWRRNKGIMFVAIDLNRPLSDQGPFDVVLHKVGVNFFTESQLSISFKDRFMFKRSFVA